jgi:hypothetical protein
MCGIPVEKFTQPKIKPMVEHMVRKSGGKKTSSTSSSPRASTPKGRASSVVRKPSVNVGGATSSPALSVKKRKTTLNTGSNSGGTSSTGVNLNV